MLRKLKNINKMTTAEFIKELQQYPQEYEVILEKDAEGNSYGPLCGIMDGVYKSENTWSGDFKPFDTEYEELDFTKEEWEDYKSNNQKVIVLYPVN